MTTNAEHSQGLDRAMNPHLSVTDSTEEWEDVVRHNGGQNPRPAAPTLRAPSTDHIIDRASLYGPWGDLAVRVKKLIVPDLTHDGVRYTREGHWVIRLLPDADVARGRLYLQVGSWRVDTITGQHGWGYGGKAYLSQHMTDSEIVQTVFGLFKAFEEHECRESFIFDGRRVFGPHLDVRALAEIADRTDARQAVDE